MFLGGKLQENQQFQRQVLKQLLDNRKMKPKLQLPYKTTWIC